MTRTRIRTRTAPAVPVAALLLLLAVSGPAAAAGCTYAGATRTVEATLTDETATFSVGPLEQIRVNGVPCQTATVTNTDTIAITGTE
ncbi:MAG: hypothetical protein M3135_04915, partial [Actinomycetota bacterium]|nr:hypothetical protein [Actinomycetota bacterium]